MKFSLKKAFYVENYAKTLFHALFQKSFGRSRWCCDWLKQGLAAAHAEASPCSAAHHPGGCQDDPVMG